MLRKPSICLVLFFAFNLVRFSAFAQSYPIDLPDSWEKGEAIALFDGDDLNHWYTFIKDRGRDEDPKKVFQVEDGILTISGEEWGCITTINPYDNYILKTSFRWEGETYGDRKTKARDSGFLIHSKGKDGGYSGIWMHGIEVQIIEGGTGDFLVVGDGTETFGLSAPVAKELQGSSHLYEPGGDLKRINKGRINWYGRSPKWSDTIGFRGKKEVEKKMGKWNDLEIQTWEGNIAVFLNGKLVNFATNVKPEFGRIQVQSEGATIAFKEITLYPLIK
ncbi:MAG: DUF1080 domain-containing protein [Cytophagales bacterium]|uniref:3-keto-disaccharide hydrolase n=1 Tax=Cyclobacterium marinum TaxID=104 RepID=UPI0011EEF91C|nr:DUF1080 domain-containing protein [Cyclobacterium marinum]MBI0397521.1 DUF1080 domain-containing protein [Cyclobacterium marinum]MBR9775912.1 DUF1080 domain-containing protein [Cytophagales bacterium]|tara:strand:- start:34443 stop:35270 length:828 start_codon:yes stop_codon:yes gene_type:complete